MKEAPQPEAKTISEEPLCSESDPEYEADNQGLDPLLISVLGDSESVNIYKIIESNFIKELEAEGFTIEESLDIAKDSDVSSLFVEGTKSIHEGFSSPVKILQEDSFSQEAGHDEQINRAKFEEFCALLSKEKSSDPAKDAFEAMLLNTILQKDESGNNEFMEKMLPGCARRIDQVLKQQKDLNQWIEVNSKIGKTPEFVAQMDDWLYQKIEKLESVVESIFLLAAQYPNLVNGFFGILNFGWWASNLTPIGLLTKVGGQLAWSGVGAALDASGSKEALAARLKGLGLVKAGDKLAGILFKLGKTFLGGKAAKISTKSIAKARQVVVKKIGNRMPMNHKYAGKVYPLKNLPVNLRGKYPHSVPFSSNGHADFSRYAIKKVVVDVSGTSADFAKANKAAGLIKIPDGYTWHHVHDTKTMMLVPRDIHEAVRHTGGSAIIREKIG